MAEGTNTAVADATDAAVEEVRARRQSIDNRLELIRVRLQKADPRRLPTKQIAIGAASIALAGLGTFAWSRRNGRLRSLDDLLVYGLSELDAAEAQIIQALPKMAARATDPELRQAFEQHLVETRGQRERLHRVFRSVRSKPHPHQVEALAGIVADTERLIRKRPNPEVLDAALVTAAQRVEHYEIATYGTVRSYAEALGYTYAADQLQQTLEEERRTDELLTRLAERFINPGALRRRTD